MLLTNSAHALVIVVMMCLLAARSAAAQTLCEGAVASGDPRVVADDLFERGRLLREQGKQAEACVCFEASHRLMPGRGGTLLNVGVCRVQAGSLLAARGALLAALDKAHTDAREDRERIAREQLAIVDTRLAWLELVPPANVDSNWIRILLDGVRVEHETWTSVPTEPGKHTISVQAQGYSDWQRELTLRASERRTVLVTQLQPDISQQDLGSHEATLPLAPPLSDPSRHAGPARRWTRLKTATMIVSAASLAVGIFAGSWALERRNAVHEHCASRECDQAGLQAAQTGHRVAALSTAAFTIGAVGAVSWLLLPGAPLSLSWGTQRSDEARR